MDSFIEAMLPSNLASKISKNGIKKTTDSIDDAKSYNRVVIDTNNMNKLDDKLFIRYLIDTSSQIDGEKVIYIDLSMWRAQDDSEFELQASPVGAICRYMRSSPQLFINGFKDYTFLFYNNNRETLTIIPKMYKSSEYNQFIKIISEMCPVNIPKINTNNDGKNNLKVIGDTETDRKESISNKKKMLVNRLADIASDADSEEEAWDAVDQDEGLKELISELEEEESGKDKISPARRARIDDLNNKFMDTTIGDAIVKDIINGKTRSEEIETAHLKVSSINEEDWDKLKFSNFQNAYDINRDILTALQSLSKKQYPISIREIKVEDTSTNMDYVDTWTVAMEDSFGKRFSLVFDIPKFKNNRFMRLRGNEKVMSGQLMLLPCLKTDEDAVQCVSNYNKIFIYRVGTPGRMMSNTDRLIKALGKFSSKDIKIVYGDNSAICSKYELPIDYIDLASKFNSIQVKDLIFIFDQDVIRQRCIENGIKLDKDKLVIGFDTNTGEPLVLKGGTVSDIIIDRLLYKVDKFSEFFKTIKPANRFAYSQASIMSNKMPLIVLLGLSIGMDKIIKLCANDKDVRFDSKKPAEPINRNKEFVVPFSDGILRVKQTPELSLLFSGLLICPTDEYSIHDVNKRNMWLDFLDEFGGRILADGLDNFVELFIDPITEEVCKHYHIPHEYHEMLIYANNLLADNKYNKHTDISGNRYRTNEVVAGYFYRLLGKAYGEYKSKAKFGRVGASKQAPLSMKRSAIIDAIMTDPCFSDLSILNPLLEVESANAVSFKGLSGMNSDRSYGLDKRTFDDSMINKISLSTGFSANVGITRQTTIDMDIEGARGYIKPTNKDEMSVTKTFSMAEAVTPFGTSRDDPFRSAMTFIQTSKHGMRTAKSMPLLVTNGADEAMAKIVSDTYTYKAKENGVVEELTDDHMIIRYTKPIKDFDRTYTTECIDLSETVKKNSDGGFFITLKLDTDLKQNQAFKKGQILAYDRSSFSNKNGESDNLAYNVGVLAKVAILNTDEGFEDSTCISEWLSDAMETDVVAEVSKDLSKNTNVYQMVKIGQKVQEGEPLMIFQNSFDEKDANILLKNITDADMVSDLGRIRVKSKYTGVIQDIKIYRTCEIDEMSESLKKIVTGYENKIKARKRMYQKFNMPGANMLDPDYKMQATGIMKNNQDGIKIVFYIKYSDKMSVGDKLVAQSANKGVVKDIFPATQEPFSEYRPEEKIHALFAARSFNARMVTSVWVSGAINKCMIELDRQVKDIMGLDYKSIEDMQ